MRILMVVSDLNFPNFDGGSRRTLETARILSRMGHEIIIFSNKSENQSDFEIIETFKVYRKKMIEFGYLLRLWFSYSLGRLKILNKIKNNFNNSMSKSNKREIINLKIKTFDGHLKVKKEWTFKDKIKEIYRHKIPIHKILKIVPALPKVLKIIKKEKIDIVYERSGSYGLGILAAKLTNRISIIDFIDILYWDFALKHCDRILSYFSTYQVPSFIPRNKIDLVYTAVDEEIFKPKLNQDKIENLYNQLGIKDKESTLIGIYVGGFYSWHGLEHIVSAVEYISKQKEFLPMNLKLKIILVGDGEMKRTIENQIKNKNLEDYFILTGRVDFSETPLYINCGDFCFNTNTADAIGLKTFEYLACGKPVLSFNIEQIPIFFKDNENMIFVNEKDPIDLANKIKFIAENPELMKKIGESARKLVEERYTWKIHGNNIIKSIKKIIKTKRE
ncbi:MAG: glycosyltransferase family 4 protein [Promethearchaeota archaeon]